MIILSIICAALGAVCRVYITDLLNAKISHSTITPTTFVNIIGSIMIVMFIPLMNINEFIHLLISGFFGGFTTFATMTKEYYELITSKQYKSFVLLLITYIILLSLTLILYLFIQ
ncbi:fluoride efflux transporter FluC [Abyssicoccus albus]|uniref:fluoride efflux transporter FluC n=1 Tax=Abyssicoccus albus TaxID=1817405 RepID=UPI00097E27A3|nr:hypothetical protein BVH56_06140 [Abyssicoccus albus]